MPVTIANFAEKGMLRKLTNTEPWTALSVGAVPGLSG